jgi:surface polysaccharide O-acyltransferase-like enzyme
MTETESKAALRQTPLDVLKTVSIFGVLMIHTAAPALAAMQVGSFGWLSAAFWGSLIRFSVPVFFLCSGALLLDPERELSIRRIYGKYMLRILLALFVWAAAYEAFDILRAVYPSGRLQGSMIRKALINVFGFHHHYHLYFLHMMILFYALLPIGRIFVKNASAAEYRYLLILWFLLGILYPSLKSCYPFSSLQGIPEQYALNMTYSALGYGFLGYYIKMRPPEKPLIPLLLFGAGFLITFGGMTAFSIARGEAALGFWEGMSPGVALMAAGLFGAAAALYRNTSAPRAVYAAAKGSFCIYLTTSFF